MNRFREISLAIILIFASATFSACQKSDDVDLAQQKSANQDSLQTEVDIALELNDSLYQTQFGKEVISEKKIMEILYDKNYDTTKKISHWKPKKSDLNQFSIKLSPDGLLHTKLHLIHLFEIDSIPHLVVLTTTSKRDEYEDLIDNSIGAAPIVGAALFKNIGKKWYLQSVNRNIGQYGSFGKLSTPTFAKIGERSYGFFITSLKEKEGVYKGILKLISINNNNFKLLGTFPTWEEKISTEEMPVENKTYSDIHIIPEKNKPYFDIKIRTIGNKKLNPEIKSSVITFSDEVKIYSFRDKEKEYKLAANSFIKSFRPLEQERIFGFRYHWGQNDIQE